MFCPHCGKQSAAQSQFCSSCGASVVSQPVAGVQAQLVRPRHPRMIAGVCSGIAIHYGWDIALVRILFAVVTCLTTGAALLFYVAAWIMIPDGLYALPPAMQSAPPQNMNQGSAA